MDGPEHEEVAVSEAAVESSVQELEKKKQQVIGLGRISISMNVDVVAWCQTNS